MRSLLPRFPTLFAAILALGLTLSASAAAQPNPVEPGMMTPRRLAAVLAVLMGVSGVVVTSTARRGAVVGWAAGSLGAAGGVLVIVTASGGLGTGQGLAGGVVAVVVGLLSMLLAARTRARSLHAG